MPTLSHRDRALNLARRQGVVRTREFDAIGVGTYASTGTQASFDGVGIGVYPGGYDNPDFMNRFSVTASVGSTSTPAQLDAAATTQFVLRPRPGRHRLHRRSGRRLPSRQGQEIQFPSEGGDRRRV